MRRVHTRPSGGVAGLERWTNRRAMSRDRLARVEKAREPQMCGGGSGSLVFVEGEDGIRDLTVTGVQTCALPIWSWPLLFGSPSGIYDSGRRPKQQGPGPLLPRDGRAGPPGQGGVQQQAAQTRRLVHGPVQIGRASCRERV